MTLPDNTEPSAEALDAAPWAKDAWFVLTIAGDGQGTSLHIGWAEICSAVVAVHYFAPEPEQWREVIDRFTDWDEWVNIDDVPWQWCASYEDGSVTVERVTDTVALDRFRAAGVREKERELEQLKDVNTLLYEMADAAEQWYWVNNKAYLATVGSQERVFDALRLLGRYPPSKDIIEPEPPHDL